jgi:hypothetical protein
MSFLFGAMVKIEKFQQAVFGLRAHSDQAFAVFHDSVSSMGMFALRLGELVQEGVNSGMDKSRSRDQKFTYAKGDPLTGVALHESTIGQTIDRCVASGPNEVFLGAMCLVSIYAAWEDHVRGDIASALSIPRENVSSDLFGDIRVYRRLIVHARSRADQTVSRCKILKWFEPGDLIIIDREKLHEIVKHIRKFPEGLITRGFDPRNH